MVVGFGIGALIGNGDGDSGPEGPGQKAGAGNQSKKTAAKKPAKRKKKSGQKDDGRSKRPVLPESTCPPDLSNCVVARGRVIYVEAVDPDGDGDAHFVTVSKENVTGGGLTVFDVRIDLRPEPLPGVGDIVGGAGPVYQGSYGQKQIEVVEFHVAR